MPKPHRHRAGFSLIEVVVSMVLVAVLAAVLIPGVFTQTRTARADAIVSELSNLEASLILFRNDVGRFPANLTYLNALPASPKDACGASISATNQAKYRGPYTGKTIVSTGGNYILSTGDSIRADLVVLPNFNSQRVINLTVAGPELDIAKIMDVKVDGVADNQSGKLQYTDNGGSGEAAGSEKLVTWTIPIRPGNC